MRYSIHTTHTHHPHRAATVQYDGTLKFYTFFFSVFQVGSVNAISTLPACLFKVFGGILSPLLAYVVMGTGPVPPSSTWPMLFGCGITGFAAQCFMSRGLQLEKAGPASLIRNLDVVYVLNPTWCQGVYIISACTPMFARSSFPVIRD